MYKTLENINFNNQKFAEITLNRINSMFLKYFNPLGWKRLLIPVIYVVDNLYT